MLETIKNLFIDKDDGSFKFGSIIAAVGGAVLGSMLLGPMLGPIAAPLIGAAALVAAKEFILPMFTGSGEQASANQNQAAVGAEQAAGQGRGQYMEPEVPNVPNQGEQRGL